MSELPYTQTFNELKQLSQRKEFEGLLEKSKRLLDIANYEHELPEISQNPHLIRFTDTPPYTQALWEIQKDDVRRPRDRLSINMTQRALWISIGYSDLQPDRGLTIGDFYANLSEQSPLRAGISERVLRNDHDKDYSYNPAYVVEQLARYAVHLDRAIALMDLEYAMPQEATDEDASIEEELQVAQAA